MTKIAFRPFTEDDLPLMFNWLARPHVRRWYAPEPGSFMELAAKYRPRTVPGSPVRAFVIQVDNADAGYIQAYRLEDFPDYAALIGAGGEAGLAGMDLFLCEEWRTGRGVGSYAIRRFFEEQVMSDPTRRACVADPHEGNAASIRAFERAGFRQWRKATGARGEVQCIMRRDRDEGAYRIAPIESRDEAECARLCRDMYVTAFGGEEGLEAVMGPGDSLYLEQLRAKRAQFPEGNVHLWRGDRIVGQLEMRLPEEEPDVAYLSLIHVVPDYRAHGLGKKLHAHAMAVSRARGKRLMRLSVARRNQHAQQFYRRLGWVVVGTRDPKQPRVVMETPVR